MSSTKISIKYGNFVTYPKRLPLVKAKGKTKSAKVLVTEEKGTDVNIATSMIMDATTEVKSCFNFTCVVTNDSDLVFPIEELQGLGQNVILITPNVVQFTKDNKPVFLISTELSKLVDKDYLITKITWRILLRHLLPERVGDIVPPKGKGWFSDPSKYKPRKIIFTGS